MNKEETLAFIRQQITSGIISPLDIVQINKTEIGTHTESANLSKKLITTFYIIGALIVVIGAIIFAAQNWDTMGAMGRILVTLGISFATFAVAMIAYKPEQNTLSQVMFTISATLAPLGAYTLLDAGAVNFTWYIQIIVALCLFVVYMVALYVRKVSVLTLITIAYASWAYMSFMVYMAQTSGDFETLIQWSCIILGTSYILIGQNLDKMSTVIGALSTKEHHTIKGILTTIGTLGILTAGITIGDLFDVFFILFIFGGFYGSIYLKSRSVLVLSALFLVIHIIKLTAIHFVNSIGWSTALIMVGFLIIGIGYMTYQVNLKYLSKNSTE